jgi:Predicted amidohydrolase
MGLRIAAVQMEAAAGAVERNVERVAQFAVSAATAGADLTVLPEAVITSYDDDVFRGPLPDAQDVAWLAPIQEAVDDTGTVLVLNSAVDRGNKRTLTDFVLIPGRDPWAAYDKQHLYPNEREVFAPGDHGASFVIGDVEIGLSVCYDANFPEHAAAAAADGAVVYANSGAYFPGGARRRDLHYAARALDNGIFVVFSGLVGGANRFIGGSGVFSPLGEKLVEVQEAEGIAVADVDVELLATARQHQLMWRDRLPQLGQRNRFPETQNA